MNNLLLIIDLQKDFINENTEDLINKIEKLIDNKLFKYVAFTKFINNKNSQFHKILNYNGCMTENGKSIVINTNNYRVFEKGIYTALNNELVNYIREKNIDTIYLCGIDSEACILKTALDLFENNYNVKVLREFCMSHNGQEMHNNAIIILEKLIGKQNVITIDE